MNGLNGHPWSVHLVPEPSRLALVGLGFAGMLTLRRARAKSRPELNHLWQMNSLLNAERQWCGVADGHR